MKKNSILLCLICLSAARVFAFSDIQVGYSSGTIGSENYTFGDFVITNHNYLNSSSTIGFAESLSFSPNGVGMVGYDNSFLLTVFAGPAFRIHLVRSNFNFSLGFRYVMDFKNRVVTYYGPQTGETIMVKDDRFFNAYCISSDLQWELEINDRVAVMTGITLSFGLGRETYTQSPKSNNSESEYRVMRVVDPFTQYALMGPIYIGIGFKI